MLCQKCCPLKSNRWSWSDFCTCYGDMQRDKNKDLRYLRATSRQMLNSLDMKVIWHHPVFLLFGIAKTPKDSGQYNSDIWLGASPKPDPQSPDSSRYYSCITHEVITYSPIITKQYAFSGSGFLYGLGSKL